MRTFDGATILLFKNLYFDTRAFLFALQLMNSPPPMVFLHKHHFDGSQLKRMHVLRLPLSTSAQNRVINAGV